MYVYTYTYTYTKAISMYMQELWKSFKKLTDNKKIFF